MGQRIIILLLLAVLAGGGAVISGLPGALQMQSAVKVDSLKEASRKLPQKQPRFSTPDFVRAAMLKLLRGKGGTAVMTKLKLIDRVNKERAAFKLPPLRENYYLDQSAQAHAKDMASRGYFSHYTPEGLSYVDRIKGAGYVNLHGSACDCRQEFRLDAPQEYGPDHQIIGTESCSCKPRLSFGENLAKGQYTVEQAIEDWMNSKNHRLNILRPEFEEIGIGLFEDIWVQNFGRLKLE